MHRKKLKLGLVDAEKTHWRVAIEANAQLAPDCHLSEHDITRLVTGRKNPSPEQAAALAQVLNIPAADLFPELKGSAQ